MKKVILIGVLALLAGFIYGQYDIFGNPLVETAAEDPANPSRIWQIIGGILFVATMFFSAQISKVRAKVVDLTFLVKECLELVEYVLEASKDGTFTPEEQVRIRKEAMDVKTAWLRLIGKK